jgi:hypothetical protein
MRYEVRKCEKAEGRGTNTYYLLVDVFDTAAGDYTEDFVIQRRATSRRIVTNRDGHLKTTSGTFIDPDSLQIGNEHEWEYETVAVDLAAEFRSVIEASIRRKDAAGRTGSTDTRIRGDGVTVRAIEGREVSR